MLQDRKTAPRRWNATQVASLVLLATVVLFGGTAAATTDSQFEKWSLRPLCVLWDGQASEAISRRVTESNPRDIDLRPIGDNLFRMQRARRSCDLGHIRAACQDYIAIMRNVSGTASDWQGSAAVCPPAIADEPRSGPDQARTASE